MQVARQESVAVEPRGELASRIMAMPANTNPRGDIFGGWIMALMDSAGAMTARTHAEGNVATISVSNIVFLRPVEVGDTVCCYTDVTRIGHTSITLCVEVWVLRLSQRERIKVTKAEFTFVALAFLGDCMMRQVVGREVSNSGRGRDPRTRSGHCL
jgi:acyl-CoA thioesterase YciA